MQSYFYICKQYYCTRSERLCRGISVGDVIQDPGARKEGAHMCWCHWNKSLENRWSWEPQACRHRNACQPGREGAWERAVAAAPFPGTFFRHEQLSGTALQEVLFEQVSLSSGFLLQIQVNDTQSLQHLSWCLRTESSQRSVLWVVLVSVLPFKHLCTLENTGLCRFQGCFRKRPTFAGYWCYFRFHHRMMK